MVKKLVYSAQEHAEAQKNVGSKKLTKEEVVYPPPATTKAKKPAKAKRNRKVKELTGPVETKISKYCFLHLDGAMANALGITISKETGDVPVIVEVVEGALVVKVKAKTE